MRSAEVGALGREDKHPIGKATMTYRAPVADISFALNHAAGFAPALADGLYGDLGDDVVEAVLTEAGKFATDILAPLNVIGDREGARFHDGAVTTPPGWKEAYHAWAEAGWNALAAPAQWGGQNLPHALNAACLEDFVRIAALTEAILPSSSEAPSVLFRVADECLVFNGAAAFGMATRIRPR